MSAVNSILALLVLHWIADFVLQTDTMAQNKSKSMKWLSIHVAVYSAPFIMFGLKFAVISGLLHMATDYVTSRITSKLWQKGDRHNFFVIIGLDQLIHAVCLILVFKYLN